MALRYFRLIGLMLLGVYPLEAGERVWQWTAFRQNDGLVHNAVSTVVESRDRAMWFATLGGISRYDGQIWRSFTAEDGLPGNVVRHLYESEDGTLWAAVGRRFREEAPQAVARFVGGRWETMPIPEVTVERSGIEQIQGVGKGMVCIVTDRGQMLHFDGKDWQLVNGADGEPLKDVQCLLRDGDGKLWVSYRSGRRVGFEFGPGLRRGGRSRGGPGGRRRVPIRTGVGLLDPNTGGWESIPGAEDLSRESVIAMAQGQDGSIWFGTWGGGLLRYRDGELQTFTSEDGLPANRVEAVLPAADGSVWVGTPAGVAHYLSREGIWEAFTERDGLPNSYVTSIREAADGSIWVGTRGGVARYATTGWIHHTEWPGLKDRGNVAIERGPDGGLWAATGEAIYRLEGGQWRAVRRFGRPTRLVDLRRGTRGEIWGATAGRVLRYNGQAWDLFEPAGGARFRVIAICPAQTGGVWVSTRSGLFQFDGRNWEPLSLERDAPALSVCETADGAIWLGLVDGVVRKAGTVERHFTADDGLPEGRVIEIVEANDGQIWISTALNGVARYNGATWTRVPEGSEVQFNGVRRIYPADDGTFWLASPIDGAIHTDGTTWARYTLREGLPGSTVWDICQDADGPFWFATDGGLACYAPDRDAPETHLRHPPGQVAPFQSVLFEFMGQDTWKQTPGRALQYAWRLDGGPWSPFGPEDRMLLNRPAFGDHTFEVRAMDLAFNVDPTPEVHPFRVLAPVWRRPWFVALSLFALTALAVSSGYALQRHRRWQEAQARLIEELEAELQEAHDMQMGLLPTWPVRTDRFEVAGRCVPANHVGGDYFTYFWLDRGERLLGFGAADVSGKAMQAAVRAMQLSGIFRYEFREARPPLEVLESLHELLQEQLDPATFITCCLGVLDVGDGRVRLSNAAHPFPYHYAAATGELNALQMPSLPLGMQLPPGTPSGHEEVEVRMAPGDLLVLYSDGVTDMQDEGGAFYEEERLETLIRQHAETGAEALVDAVVEDLARFKGSAPQADDVTLLVLHAVPEG